MISRRSLFKTLLSTVALAPLAVVGLASETQAQTRNPPPPYFEARPLPRRGYTWVPGHWNWTGARGWVWQGGHWEENRRGFNFVGPRWVLRRGQWVYEPGRWVRAR